MNRSSWRSGRTAHHAKDFRLLIADHAHGQLVAGDEFLDQQGLPMIAPERFGNLAQLLRPLDHGLAANALAGPFPGRLDQRGKARESRIALDHREDVLTGPQHHAARTGDPGRQRQPLGTVLVQRDGTGQRIGTSVRDAEHLQHGGNTGLAGAGDASPLGNVEDEVRRLAQQQQQQFPAVAEEENVMAQTTQDAGDGLHRDRTVKFFLEIIW